MPNKYVIFKMAYVQAFSKKRNNNLGRSCSKLKLIELIKTSFKTCCIKLTNKNTTYLHDYLFTSLLANLFAPWLLSFPSSLSSYLFVFLLTCLLACMLSLGLAYLPICFFNSCIFLFSCLLIYLLTHLLAYFFYSLLSHLLPF